MKILYHHRTRSKDGQYVHIEEMIHALRAQGHEVIVVCPPASEKAEFGSDAGAVAWLKRHMPKFMYELMEFSYSWVAYRRLKAAVIAHRPDVLYERYNLFLPAGVWIKKKFKLPMLLEVNAPIFDERSRYDGIALKSFARWTEVCTWRGADKVLPVTRVLGDIVQQAGVPAERITVIPNGIDPEKFSHVPDTETAKAQLGLQNRIVLGFTGFVRDWHGLDQVIDFIAQSGDTPRKHLLIVGDGPAKPDLQAQAKRLDVADRVTFTGIVHRDQVANHVAAYDIALQPAVVAYASPLKLFEYLALGRAIVAPATPNIMEILTHEQNALLFPAGDNRAMCAAIERLCNDPDLRNHIGRGAAQTIDRLGLTWWNNATKAAQLVKAKDHDDDR